MPREFFLLFAFALPDRHERDLPLAGALGGDRSPDGGRVLSDTSARHEIEERFLSFRDVFGALFFFVFGLSIDVEALDSVGWLIALAVVLGVAGKLGGTYAAGRVGGFTQRQSLNAGAALVAAESSRSSSPRWQPPTRLCRRRRGAISWPSQASTCWPPPSSASC